MHGGLRVSRCDADAEQASERASRAHDLGVPIVLMAYDR